MVLHPCYHFGRHGEWKKLGTKCAAKVTDLATCVRWSCAKVYKIPLSYNVVSMVFLKLNWDKHLQEILFYALYWRQYSSFHPGEICDVHCRHGSWSSPFDKTSGNWADDNKNGGILFKETVFNCSLGFATALQSSSKLKAMRFKDYNQTTWLKICLTNKYYMKTDFLWEKVFIVRALVKNKVGKMCLLLQATSRLCELSKIIRVSSFHPTCKVYMYHTQILK